MNKKIIKQAFHLTIPIMLGYIFVAIAFSLVMQEKGYGLGYCLLMSIFVYAGSMQFAGIGLLVNQTNLIHVAMMTLMVNIRHIFYGLSLMEPYKKMKNEKFYFIHSLSDETYSLLCMHAHEDKKLLLCIGLLNQLYWVIGTILGCLIGQIIPFDTSGIEFAMNALFIVIFLEQFLSCEDHLPSFIGIIVSLICLLLFKADRLVFTSMFCILFSLIIYRKVRLYE